MRDRLLAPLLSDNMNRANCFYTDSMAYLISTQQQNGTRWQIATIKYLTTIVNQGIKRGNGLQCGLKIVTYLFLSFSIKMQYLKGMNAWNSFILVNTPMCYAHTAILRAVRYRRFHIVCTNTVTW